MVTVGDNVSIPFRASSAAGCFDSTSLLDAAAADIKG